MAENFTERLDDEYDTESKGSAFSCILSQQQEPTEPFQASTNVVLCWC